MRGKTQFQRDVRSLIGFTLMLLFMILMPFLITFGIELGGFWVLFFGLCFPFITIYPFMILVLMQIGD